MIQRFVFAFGRRSNYIVAVLVGTLINAYGQLFVPYLSGVGSPATALVDRIRRFPRLTMLSIFIGYVFPFVVSVLSSMLMYRDEPTLDELPWSSPVVPEPVLRISSSGAIVAAGRQTRALLDRHGVARLDELIGETNWRELAELFAAAAPGDFGCRQTECAVLDARYQLVWIRAQAGMVNLYLTGVSGDS